MAEGGIDVLMRVVDSKGPLEAESSTVFAPSTAPPGLREGFVPGQFCELREFSFSAGVSASLSKKEPKDKGQALLRAQAKNEKRAALVENQETWSRERKQEYAAEQLDRRQDKKGSKRHVGESIDMQPVEFTRVMDAMSTRLFQALVNCETLEEISVVKRKASGSSNSGSCYLRLDFKKVLVTNVDWKDAEHVILESCTFIYREVTIRYRPQAADGSLGAVVQSKWVMKAAGQGG